SRPGTGADRLRQGKSQVLLRVRGLSERPRYRRQRQLPRASLGRMKVDTIPFHPNQGCRVNGAVRRHNRERRGGFPLFLPMILANDRGWGRWRWWRRLRWFLGRRHHDVDVRLLLWVVVRIAVPKAPIIVQGRISPRKSTAKTSKGISEGGAPATEVRTAGQ